MSAKKTESVREGGIDTELLTRILGSSMKVTVEGIDERGDIFFYTSLRSIGLTKSDFVTASNLIRTRFFTDMVGELLIRYNIDEFLRYMNEMVDPNQYLSMVSRTRHDRFGLYLLEDEEAMRFQFHISLLQHILSEDINRIIK